MLLPLPFGVAGSFIVPLAWMVIEPFLALPFTGKFGNVRFRRGLFWTLCGLWLVASIVGSCEGR